MSETIEIKSMSFENTKYIVFINATEKYIIVNSLDDIHVGDNIVMLNSVYSIIAVEESTKKITLDRIETELNLTTHPTIEIRKQIIIKPKNPVNLNDRINKIKEIIVSVSEKKEVKEAELFNSMIETVPILKRELKYFLQSFKTDKMPLISMLYEAIPEVSETGEAIAKQPKDLYILQIAQNLKEYDSFILDLNNNLELIVNKIHDSDDKEALDALVL